jgi:hypothetical protein
METRWKRVAVVGLFLIALGYVVSVYSFSQSVMTQVPTITDPSSGVRVVFVPERVNAADQSVAGRMLLYPAPSLEDSDQRLLQEVVVDVVPAVDGGLLRFPPGRKPEPQTVVLAAPGVVQEYPWDRYQLSVQVSASTIDNGDAGEQDVPSEATIYFRMPSWRMSAATADIRQGTWSSNVEATFTRAGSTRSIAVVLLALMVVLAAIAVGLVITTARGRRDWEFVHATWMTSMLFALMPLRSSFPGDPPLGVWIDILVFFWVEVAIMACVAVTAFALVMRAADPSGGTGARTEPATEAGADQQLERPTPST